MSYNIVRHRHLGITGFPLSTGYEASIRTVEHCTPIGVFCRVCVSCRLPTRRFCRAIRHWGTREWARIHDDGKPDHPKLQPFRRPFRRQTGPPMSRNGSKACIAKRFVSFPLLMTSVWLRDFTVEDSQETAAEKRFFGGAVVY